MKKGLLVAFLLLVYLGLTEAWLIRSRRRSSNQRSDCHCTYYIEKDSNGNNVQSLLKGTVDYDGKVELGDSFERKGVEIQSDLLHYQVALRADPCSLNIYDGNSDGVIVPWEMHTLFGNNTKADSLFRTLDNNGDGRVSEPEFYIMSPMVINDCDEDD